MRTVEIAGVRTPLYHETPGWIPDVRLILTPTARRNLQKILHPLNQGCNLLLVGDAGVGKNALIYYINKLRAHPTVRYSFNEDTLPEDLVGAYRIDPVTHRFVWADGPLAHAMRTGAVFVADEMNLCPPEVLKRFYSVFTDRSLQLLEGDSTVIEAAPGFAFVATQNPAEGFEGRKNLPREIQKHFATVYVDSYPHDELVEILAGLFPDIQRGAVETIVRINTSVEALVNERKAGVRDLERFHFNIRNLSRLGARLSNERADGLLELSDIFVATFRSEEDRRLVRNTMAELAHDAPGFGDVMALRSERSGAAVELFFDPASEAVRIGRAELKRAEFSGAAKRRSFTESVERAFDELPPVPAVRPALESLMRSIELGENALLECEADVEPEDYVKFFAELLDRPLAVITLSRGMHTADVLGGLKPAPDAANEREAVRWVDGPLTTAVRRGDFILLKGLEAAGPELVEKLNMLLDDARALALPPESGETAPIRLRPEARIFGLKFFRMQRSTPSISRAFRNRFTALTLAPVIDPESLREIAARRLGVDENGPAEKLLRAMTQFHLMIRERSLKREIGAAQIQPYQFGLTNLRRWCEHIRAEFEIEGGEKFQTLEVVIRGAGVAYLNEIAESRERDKMALVLENLLGGLPADEILKELERAASKKKLITQSSETKKIWWDQKENWRPANTGKFKAKLEGRSMKAGVDINTPETGGQTKEGKDAWYGSDTQGNQGQGEPGAGGGAWGYRTEELYKEFLKKRRALWDYNITVSLEEFKEIFGPEIQRVTVDFDRLLDPQVDITRRYLSQGSRVDARRYLSYIAGRGDGRVFDRTTVTVDDDKLKGVEIIFAVNKGRRIFNFEYSIATLVAIMSCATILENHQIPFGVSGYSDLSNMKSAVDIMWYKTIQELFGPGPEEDLFYGLARNWHGDTVAEWQLLEELTASFSPDARTRIIVLVSDFRGARAKVTLEKDMMSDDTARLKQTADQLTRRGVILLGVGVGARAIADALFTDSLHVGGETYAELPQLMAGRVTELIHRHHNAAAM